MTETAFLIMKQVAPQAVPRLLVRIPSFCCKRWQSAQRGVHCLRFDGKGLEQPNPGDAGGGAAAQAKRPILTTPFPTASAVRGPYIYSFRSLH